MTKEREHGPVVTFCKRSGSTRIGLSSLIDGGELKTQDILPKGSFSSVIMHDNKSEQRLLELKKEHFENLKKKTVSFYDNLKKKFLNDQQKKNERWAKEHDIFVKYMERDKQNQHETPQKKNTNTLDNRKRPPLGALRI
ncbi:uncharacterized protein C5orf52-like [Ambystoma mexicanum]|uniref:uncharacterized protein C5orf52-like n=1 Tax=Ambystoma mexicanum TaxID=8296 RepID=UPI0037E95876